MIYYIIVLLIILIVWIYIRYTYKVPPHETILQSSLNDFELKRLLEKQPIVIQDQVEDIEPIWKGWFKYNPKREFEITPDMEWIKNKYKYMLLHSKEDCEVLLCSPRCKTIQGIPDPEESVTAIKLYKGMSLIIPFQWYFTVTKSVHACGVHDWITYFLP